MARGKILLDLSLLAPAHKLNATFQTSAEDPMKYRWTIAPPQPLLAAQLAKTVGISPLLAQCLLNR
ncbi:MAG: hypothetical protein DME25_09595, partial [Verrucomicrobia bacterium]